MLDLSEKTVREIALARPATTKVFEAFKIDYCCGGQRPFQAACQSAGVAPELVMQSIDELLANEQPADTAWLTSAPAGEIIGYIEKKHHTRTREETAQLPPLMAKVVAAHGANHPALEGLQEALELLCADLTPHLLKEEVILFPYIKELETSLADGARPAASCFGTVQNPVRMMLQEHDRAGELLRRMRDITRDYSLPEDACPSYTALFHRLAAFEYDLHQHIHLENNLLFPLAVKLEETVAAALRG